MPTRAAFPCCCASATSGLAKRPTAVAWTNRRRLIPWVAGPIGRILPRICGPGTLGDVRRELARHRGREIDTAGAGFLATFDGPARAIRCAVAITSGVRELGIEVRVSLHTGEVELR